MVICLSFLFTLLVSLSYIIIHSSDFNIYSIFLIWVYRNKIGYKYWLMRFIFQCLFYILVLVTVFLQVYNDQGNRMAGLFVAIIALACIFLWLELIQLIRDKKSYLSYVV